MMGFLNLICVIPNYANELCKDYIITRDVSFMHGTIISEKFKKNPVMAADASLLGSKKSETDMQLAGRIF